MVSKSKDNTVAAQMKITKGMGVTASSYSNAPLYIRADTASDPTVRAQIALENAGSQAGTLFLDIDGRLKWQSSSGATYQLDMTPL